MPNVSVKKAIAQACKGGERVSEVSRDFGVDKSVFSRIFKAERRDNLLKKWAKSGCSRKTTIDKRVSF